MTNPSTAPITVLGICSRGSPRPGLPMTGNPKGKCRRTGESACPNISSFCRLPDEPGRLVGMSPKTVALSFRAEDLACSGLNTRLCTVSTVLCTPHSSAQFPEDQPPLCRVQAVGFGLWQMSLDLKRLVCRQRLEGLCHVHITTTCVIRVLCLEQTREKPHLQVPGLESMPSGG